MKKKKKKKIGLVRKLSGVSLAKTLFPTYCIFFFSFSGPSLMRIYGVGY